MVSGVANTSEHSPHMQKHNAQQGVMHTSMDCHNDAVSDSHEAAAQLSELCKLDCQLSLCAATPAYISSGLHFTPLPKGAALSFYTFNLHPSLQDLPFRPPLTA
jgi:hypothetical protein